MAYADHQSQASTIVARCAIVTLSDTRTPDTDTSGDRIGSMIAESKHAVTARSLIRDEPSELKAILAAWIAREDVDAIISNGGTGISRRDQSIDVIETFIDHPLPGFGELFRMLSYEQIGSGAMLSRASAGVANGKLIFALPGSTKAVELAMSKLILPELSHLVFELRK